MNMLEYAGPNLTEDQRENLEMVYSEVYQLTQLFIEWDWEKYFQEIGSEDAKYSLVNPGIGTVRPQMTSLTLICVSFDFGSVLIWASFDFGPVGDLNAEGAK